MDDTCVQITAHSGAIGIENEHRGLRLRSADKREQRRGECEDRSREDAGVIGLGCVTVLVAAEEWDAVHFHGDERFRRKGRRLCGVSDGVWRVGRSGSGEGLRKSLGESGNPGADPGMAVLIVQSNISPLLRFQGSCPTKKCGFSLYLSARFRGGEIRRARQSDRALS